MLRYHFFLYFFTECPLCFTAIFIQLALLANLIVDVRNTYSMNVGQFGMQYQFLAIWFRWFRAKKLCSRWCRALSTLCPEWMNECLFWFGLTSKCSGDSRWIPPSHELRNILFRIGYTCSQFEICCSMKWWQLQL